MKFIQVPQTVSKALLFVKKTSASKFHKNNITRDIFDFLRGNLNFITREEPGKQLFHKGLRGMDKYGMNHIRAWIKFHIIDESDHTAIHHIDDLSSANIRIFQFYHLFQYMPFTRRCCLGIKFFFQNRNGVFFQT